MASEWEIWGLRAAMVGMVTAAWATGKKVVKDGERITAVEQCQSDLVGRLDRIESKLDNVLRRGKKR